MSRTKQFLGKLELKCPGIPIKNAKFIPANLEQIAKANRELAEKCRSQRENDAETSVWAKTHGCC